MRLTLVLVAAILSYTASFSQNLSELNWILGKWDLIEGSTTTTEFWEIKDDSTFVGSGITKQGETVLFEEGLRIEFRNGTMSYVAILPDKTAHFKLTKLDGHSVTFEDPKNDFPSKILYDFEYEKMNITISGTENGETQSIKMFFNRK